MITEGGSCPRLYPTSSPSSRQHAARHDYAEALPRTVARPFTTQHAPITDWLECVG